MSDPVLPGLLKRLLPAQIHGDISKDCERLGELIQHKLGTLGLVADSPVLTQYDQWGKRIDRLQTSEGWRELKAVCQKEGVPAIFYEHQYGQHTRTYGFVKAFLLMGHTYTAFCPLSMTDGCAQTLERLGTDEMKKDILPRLVSRDPTNAFTAGQWMTERPGGSDVSRTETYATITDRSDKYGQIYQLNGFKWFSSATDSEVAVALARTGDANNGSRTLSLFLVPLRKPLFPQTGDAAPSSTSNGIKVHRLKGKIGTHTLPTAELSIENAESYLLGTLNEGVKNILPVLNITRVYSAISSVGHLRRCIAISTAYSRVRAVEGGRTLLMDSALHVEELSKMHITYRALVHFVFGVAHLMGKVYERGGQGSGEDARRLRMMTAIVKAFCAELTAPAIEQAMCAMGGAGYMEENHIGRLLRDALVERIWEGTTSVLGLELARAAQDGPTLASLVSWAKFSLQATPSSLATSLREPLAHLERAISLHNLFASQPSPFLLRPLLMLTGYMSSAFYLLEHAIWSEDATDIAVFQRWVTEGGLVGAIADVEAAAKRAPERGDENAGIVYGPRLAISKL